MVLLYAPSHRQDSSYHGLCYTSRGALAGTRKRSNECKIMNYEKKNEQPPAKCLFNILLIIEQVPRSQLVSIYWVCRGRAFAHGAVGRQIDPSWCGPIELFLVPASAPRLVCQRLW